MSFETYERSSRDGKPIGLYRFIWGNTSWAYTSADSEQVVNQLVGGIPTDVTYTPIPIGDNGLIQSGTSDGSATQDFTIVCPSTLPVVDLFRGTPPTEPVFIEVRRKHLQDAEAPFHWIGKIGNVRGKEDPGSVEIIGRISGLRRGGLRLCWQRSCPYFLFDDDCTLSKAAFADPRNVTAIAGSNVTVDGAALAAGYFDGGFIEWDADGLGTLERRLIESTAGNVAKLFGRGDGIDVGLAVTLYPGCDGSSTTCDTKFNNLDNHGSVDFMPGKSPFDGTQVF